MKNVFYSSIQKSWKKTQEVQLDHISAIIHFPFLWKVLPSKSCHRVSWGLLLPGLTVRSVVPVGLTWTITLEKRFWTPISWYTGRICVTLHFGSQSCQLGSVATEMINLRGPPISCLFITATASLLPDKGRSHTSKLSPCEQDKCIPAHWQIP